MKMKKVTVVLLVICMIFSMCACKKKHTYKELYTEDMSVAQDTNAIINMYYTDSNMKEFLEAAVVAYKEKYNNVTINLLIKQNANYIENIAKSNTADGSGVDLYMISHSHLERAYLAGITMENTNKELYNSDNYASSAIASLTYKEKLLGYPLYYDTSFFISNRLYSSDGVSTFAELANFAETFEPTEEMVDFKNVFEWNVSDVISNYAFIGGVTNITGVNGDEKDSINIYNQEAINALKEFQDLKNYFSIDRNVIETKTVIDNFKTGKTAFSILSTKDLEAIVDCDVDYNISSIPSISTNDNDVNSLAAARALSVTELVMVNPYSANKAVANSFAQFLTSDAADMLYQYSGKLSCKKSVVYEKAELNDLIKIYENSVPKTKLMNLSELYMYVEIMFHNIWDGEPVETELGKIKNYLAVQLK